jgi:hypothetical protein
LNVIGWAIEAIGWTGAGLILGAYLLVSMGRLSGQSAVFQGMNVAGAAGFVVNSGWHGAIPSTVLNIVWLGIGTFTLWRIAQKPSST